MKGGVKVKKQKEDVNTLQEVINIRLREMIDMKSFIKEQTDKLKANTWNIICPNCHTKDNIYSETVQLRALDEAADQILKCLTCGYSWKISGSSN